MGYIPGTSFTLYSWHIVYKIVAYLHPEKKGGRYAMEGE